MLGQGDVEFTLSSSLMLTLPPLPVEPKLYSLVLLEVRSLESSSLSISCRNRQIWLYEHLFISQCLQIDEFDL